MARDLSAQPATGASKPLAGVTVLDLTRVRSGPTAVRQLADWGAEVIKIEMPPGAEGEPVGGPREGPDFQNLHRNKRAITLDLKAPDGLAVFGRMAERADVIVENFRPDVKERLGSTIRRCAGSTAASSSPASPVSARTAPTATGPASTRSRKGWAG